MGHYRSNAGASGGDFRFKGGGGGANPIEGGGGPEGWRLKARGAGEEVGPGGAGGDSAIARGKAGLLEWKK